MSPRELVERALAAWGVTVDPDTRKLLMPDGSPMRKRWCAEPTQEVLPFPEDAEDYLAHEVLTDAYYALKTEG